MKLLITKNTVSKSVYLFVQDSSSTTGAGLVDLDSSADGLKAYYILSGGAPTKMSLNSFDGSAMLPHNAPYKSDSFIQVDADNMPGVYRLDLPNELLDGFDGSNPFEEAIVMIHGALNMAPVLMEIQLVGFDVTSDFSVDALTTRRDIDGFSTDGALKTILAFVAAKTSGAATTTVIFRSVDDTRDMITMTVDSDGDRSDVVIDAG